MHYCALLFTKNFPTEEEISEIMRPYDEEFFEYDKNGEIIGDLPAFQYDCYSIGGRYGGKLKLKVDYDDKYYNWDCYSNNGRNKHLFYSKLLSVMKSKLGIFFDEEDWFTYMGLRDGFIYVDGARVDDLINFDDLSCYVCIDADGNVIARETWNGHDFVEDEQFDEKFETIKKNSKGMFVTVLDLHD